MRAEPNVPLFHGPTVRDADLTPIQPTDSFEVQLCARAVTASVKSSAAFHYYEANRYVEGAFHAYREASDAETMAFEDLAGYRQNRARDEARRAA